jgi:hypothetical protein
MTSMAAPLLREAHVPRSFKHVCKTPWSNCSWITCICQLIHLPKPPPWSPYDSSQAVLLWRDFVLHLHLERRRRKGVRPRFCLLPNQSFSVHHYQHSDDPFCHQTTHVTGTHVDHYIRNQAVRKPAKDNRLGLSSVIKHIQITLIWAVCLPLTQRDPLSPSYGPSRTGTRLRLR